MPTKTQSQQVAEFIIALHEDYSKLLLAKANKLPNSKEKAAIIQAIKNSDTKLKQRCESILAAEKRILQKRQTLHEK